MSVATRSPAPTPVAATTIPGPMYFQLDFRGVEVAAAPVAALSLLSVVSAMTIKKA